MFGSFGLDFGFEFVFLWFDCLGLLGLVFLVVLLDEYFVG